MNYNIQEILNICKSRPIVIWGAGMTGRGLLDVFEKRLCIKPDFFVDNNVSYHGNCISDIRIHPPKLLFEKHIEEKRPFVFVAVAIKEKEIIYELIRAGYKESLDYVLISKLVPAFYTVDIVGVCNLKCPSCPRGNHIESIPTGIMSIELFECIVNKILTESPFITHLALYNWGEPLLHPQLPKLIQFLNEKNIFSALSTNFSITNLDINKLVASRPGELKISCSGYFQPVYGQTHKNGDIRLVKSNMYRLRYYMDKLKSNLSVKVEYHMYQHNTGEDLTQMASLCNELGFVFNPYIAVADPVEAIIDRAAGKTNAVLEEINKILLVSLDEGLLIGRQNRSESCNYLNQVNINFDGSLALCCVSFDPKLNMLHNNYLECSIGDIERIKNSHSMCGQCMELGIPEYLMGIDEDSRKKIADTKHINRL